MIESVISATKNCKLVFTDRVAGQPSIEQIANELLAYGIAADSIIITTKFSQ